MENPHMSFPMRKGIGSSGTNLTTHLPSSSLDISGRTIPDISPNEGDHGF